VVPIGVVVIACIVAVEGAGSVGLLCGGGSLGGCEQMSTCIAVYAIAGAICSGCNHHLCWHWLCVRYFPGHCVGVRRFAFVVGPVCSVTINIYPVVVVAVVFCVGVVSRVIIVVVGSVVFFVAVVMCGSDVIGAVMVIVLGNSR